MLIHKDALVVSEVGTPEESRYFLNGALFDKEGRAVATDGHVLVRFTSDPCPADDFPALYGVKDIQAADDVILSSGDLKAARGTMAKNGTIAALDYLAIVPTKDHVSIITTDLNRQVNIRARKNVGTFPAYQAILASTKAVVGEVLLDPKLLGVVARMAAQVGAKSIKFVLQKSDGTTNTEPVLFTAKGEHGVLDGAVMPQRSGN